jgi:hypothetical protein
VFLPFNQPLELFVHCAQGDAELNTRMKAKDFDKKAGDSYIGAGENGSIMLTETDNEINSHYTLGKLLEEIGTQNGNMCVTSIGDGKLALQWNPRAFIG